ncbi:MAG: ATP-binding protein [Janthinobacterium lividum]
MPTETKRDDLFPILSAEEIACLMPHGTPQTIENGETLFSEGDTENEFYVILEGALKVTRNIAGEEVLLTQHNPGQFTGALSLFDGENSIATGQAVGSLCALRISLDGFLAIMADCSTIAAKIIAAMVRRRPEADALVQQREKMAALGKLSAGLAHELNNPAAAARRAAAKLRDSLETLQRSAFELGGRNLSASQKDLLLTLQRNASPPGLAALALSEREDSLADWLDSHDIPDSYNLAGPLAEAGFTEESLDSLAEQIPEPDAIAASLAWLGASLESVEMLRTVEQSTDRISELVSAIKAYSYRDQAPQQEVDVQNSIETTLTILRFKCTGGVQVNRDYQPDLPCITAYGSELNQVWTNLMDNAIDAMDGHGQLFVKTALEDNCILVEIGDDGPGIPAEVQQHIFEPFFTTKDVGKGTGLGLDTAYRIIVTRHHGDLRVLSQPGSTRFQVRLPIHGPTAN